MDFFFFQVQAYLELLGVDQGAVVEVFRNDSGRVAVNVVPVPRDKILWNRSIVPKIRSFVAVLLHILRDTETQDGYLQSKRPAFILARMQLSSRSDTLATTPPNRG